MRSLRAALAGLFGLLAIVIGMASQVPAQQKISAYPVASPAMSDVFLGDHGGSLGVGGTTSKFPISALYTLFTTSINGSCSGSFSVALVDTCSNQGAIGGNKTFTGNVAVNGTSTLSGAATFGSTIAATGAISTSSTLTATGITDSAGSSGDCVKFGTGGVLSNAASGCVTALTAGSNIVVGSGTTPSVAVTGAPTFTGDVGTTGLNETGQNVSASISTCFICFGTTGSTSSDVLDFGNSNSTGYTEIGASGGYAGGVTGNLLTIGSSGTTIVAINSGGGIGTLGTVYANGALVAGITNTSSLAAGDVSAARSTTTGKIWIGGSSSNCPVDYGISLASDLTIGCALIVNNAMAVEGTLSLPVTPLGVTSGGTGAVFGSGSAITAASSAINTTETVLTTLPLGSGSPAAGTTLDVELFGTCTTTAANASTFTIRFGTTGTTSDATVATGAVTAALSGTAIPFAARVILTVRSTGTSATSAGYLILTNGSTGGTTTGITTVDTTNLALTTSSFNSTVSSGIFSITYKSAATTTTSTFQNAIIELLHA